MEEIRKEWPAYKRIFFLILTLRVMIRFYAPDIVETKLLPEIESSHCCRVLRMKAGDILHVVDGKGYSYKCELIKADSRHAEVKILETEQESKYWKEHITLAVAPTKNIDRIEWLLEKIVEIGVDEIVLLKCDRSERKHINEERLSRILVSAMKQSLKANLPVFGGLISFKDFIDYDPTENKYIGYCSDTLEKKDFSKTYPGNKDVTVLIGPEGDFSDDEIKYALHKGYVPVTFGDSRLRTETAALYGIIAVHVIDSVKS